jgi:hypothetical protein
VALQATQAIPTLMDALPRLSWRERLRVRRIIRLSVASKLGFRTSRVRSGE